jgi:diguanylate cyclase (GGDEF)-like protein
MSDLSKTAQIPAVPIDDPDAAPRTVEGETSVPPTERHSSIPQTAREAPSSSPGAPTEKAISIAAPPTRDRATLTIITGLDAGRVFALDMPPVIVGRGPEAQVSIDDSAISRAHARVSRRDDGKFEVEDLGSMNGSFVRGRPIGKAVLSSGDRVQIGPNVVLRFAVTDEAEEELLRKLYESSTKDALTGAYNRKYFGERVASEVAYARRNGTALAVLMIDLDHFKRINDTHGHLVGDQVLRAVAGVLARTIRREDIFARLGGDELVVLARSAPELDAERLGERLRANVEALRVPTVNSLLTVSVSVGVARLAECPGAAGEADLLALADARLYEAKARGRNRVVAG